MRKTLILAISALLLAAACSGDSPRGGPGLSGSVGTAEATTGGGDQGDTVVDLDPGDVVLTAGLVRFDDCDTLLDYLHTEYSARVGPWGFDGGGWFGPMPITEGGMDEEMAMAADDMAEAAAPAQVADTSATAAPVEGVDFSGTNVQEAGVDEADIVKTDGRRIFTLSAGRLVVVDAAGRTRTGEVTVAEGWGRELFNDGDSLLLITRSASDANDRSETVLQRIDVSGGTPEIIGTVNVQGDYTSARSVGGTARVIMRYDPQWSFPFVFPQNEDAEDVAKTANRAAVLNSTLDDWLPHYTTGTADSSTGSLMVPCGDVHAPSVFSGFGMTTVISVPIGGDFDPSSSTAVMAPGDTVYASTGSLYVATTRWVESGTFDDDNAWEEAWRQRRTSVHRFDISGAQAAYESSGEVLGVIHNQFSLSEHDGYLRVVTTV
ncbi:MAG: beta-propeller domain-containing protein, partial [Acidimicrobiaceae bacterium]|nr:beta-propeller domain-containing protein [Acidimicrobiaceae bacterium]